MRILPIWARKPKHKMKVIATSKGWVVEKTGEVLVSHKGLDEKLESLRGEMESAIKETKDVIVSTPDEKEDEVVEEPKTEEKVEEPTTEEPKTEEKVEEVVEEPKTEEKVEEPTTEEPVEQKQEEKPSEEKPKTTKRRGRPPKNANSANKSK